MPEAMERKLKAEAKKKGFGKKRTGAYVYGTMRKTGWKPSTQMHTTLSPNLVGHEDLFKLVNK